MAEAGHLSACSANLMPWLKTADDWPRLSIRSHSICGAYEITLNGLIFL